MKLLLDTHIFVWWLGDPTKLSREVLDLCQDPDNLLLVSVVSIWEILIKHPAGRVRFTSPLPDLLERQEKGNNVGILPVVVSHMLGLNGLLWYPEHKDPFDRLLIAQAKVENATLLTVDDKIHRYSYPIRCIK